MNAPHQITAIEAKLIAPRAGHPGSSAVLLPTIVLLAIGVLFAPHNPIRCSAGGATSTCSCRRCSSSPWRRSASTRCRAGWPSTASSGVLRRLSTTPVEPGPLLVAQLLVNMVVGVGRRWCILVIVGNLAFADPAAAATCSASGARSCSACPSLFALGLLVAAIAPTSRCGNGDRAAALRDRDVPGWRLSAALAAAGDPGPASATSRRPGVQALHGRLVGYGAAAPAAGVMAGITVVAGARRAKLFRWE